MCLTRPWRSGWRCLFTALGANIWKVKIPARELDLRQRIIEWPSAHQSVSPTVAVFQSFISIESLPFLLPSLTTTSYENCEQKTSKQQRSRSTRKQASSKCRKTNTFILVVAMLGRQLKTSARHSNSCNKVWAILGIIPGFRGEGQDDVVFLLARDSQT